MLTKQQRRRRQRRREQERVTEPMTLKELKRETRAATNLRFRPAERAKGAELRASQRRQGELGQWWQNYLQMVGGAQAATSAAYQQAGATQANLINAAGARDQATTAALQQEASQSAALRGAPLTQDAANREAAAAGQRSYLSAAQGGALAAQGAVQGGYLANAKRVGMGQSIAARQAEQRRQQSIEQERSALRNERGDYAANKRGELKKGERDYLVQRQAAELDNREFQQQNKENAEDREIDWYNAKTGRKNSESGGGNSAQREKTANWNDAKAGALTLFESKEWASWGALMRALQKEGGVDPAMARRAVEQLRKRVEREEARHSVGDAVDLNPFY